MSFLLLDQRKKVLGVNSYIEKLVGELVSRLLQFLVASFYLVPILMLNMSDSFWKLDFIGPNSIHCEQR